MAELKVTDVTVSFDENTIIDKLMTYQEYVDSQK